MTPSSHFAAPLKRFRVLTPVPMAWLLLLSSAVTGCGDEQLSSAEADGEANSALAQAQRGLANRRNEASTSGQHDSMQDYARKCDAATGIHVPAFHCNDGVEVPNQQMTDRMHPDLCDRPNVLNHECDPGSRFQVLPGRTADAVAVAHCRKRGIPVSTNMFNDIAVIQYNKKNGAICFYQALSSLPGDVPEPLSQGESTWPGSTTASWISPQRTENIGCTGCHDNGGFIRSEYLAQLTALPHALPSTADGFNNLTTPVRYVGLDYQSNRSWSITTKNAPGDTGPSCTSCHRLAVNNFGGGTSIGTAVNFALIATAASQKAKSPHSARSPIWMRPGQITYDPLAEASAKAFSNCATGFAASGFTTAPAGCDISPLGEPWPEQPSGLGTACSGNGECASNYCDAGWGTSQTNRCMPNHNGQSGDTCSNDNQCTSLNCDGLHQNSSGTWIPGACAVKKLLNASCSANGQCNSSYCDMGWGTSQTNRCMPNKNGQIGDACSNDNQCSSLVCGGLHQDASGAWVPGNCSSKKSLGAVCSANSQCGSNYCDAGWGTSQTNQCMPNRNGQIGDICSNDNQCISAICGGLHQSASGAWVPGACSSKKSIGAACSANSQCGSNYCDAGWGTSQTNLCMPNGNGHAGDMCSNWNQCLSRSCPGLHSVNGRWIPGVCQ